MRILSEQTEKLIITHLTVTPKGSGTGGTRSSGRDVEGENEDDWWEAR